MNWRITNLQIRNQWDLAHIVTMINQFRVSRHCLKTHRTTVDHQRFHKGHPDHLLDALYAQFLPEIRMRLPDKGRRADNAVGRALVHLFLWQVPGLLPDLRQVLSPPSQNSWPVLFSLPGFFPRKTWCRLWSKTHHQTLALLASNSHSPEGRKRTALDTEEDLR